MILGLGSDLSDIRRIQQSLDRFGQRFTHRVFTEIERTRSDRKADVAASYAKRFAAKEACAKALGTGVPRVSRLLGDLSVLNPRCSRPSIPMWVGGAERLASLIPPGMSPVIHVSLTDDHPYAQAFVIIEAVADHQP